MSRWSRWVEAVGRREPAHAVALVRIGVGVSLVSHYCVLFSTGVWRWIWLAPEEGGVVPLSHSILDKVGVHPPLVQAIMAVGLVGSVALTLGAWVPMAAVLTAVCWGLLNHVGPNAGGSYEFLGSNLLYLLIFSGAGEAFGVDGWRRRRRGETQALVPVWPRWLMVWQLVVMYDTTAWQKVSAGWIPGGPLDALWYILQQPTWHRFDMRWLAPLYPLTRVATLTTWCFEHAAPTLVLAAWFRATRTRAGWLRATFNRLDWRVLYLTMGLFLHAQIELFMEVGLFSPFTVSAYAAAFSGEEVRRLFRRYGPTTG